MERRLRHHKLLGRTTFVEALPADSPLVDERLAGLPLDAADPRRRAEAACLASHLKAIRTFLERSPESTRGAIVCEDDALLRNDWDPRFAELLDNLPADAPLCALSYHLSSWDGVLWAGRRPERQNLCTFVPRTTWGAVAYWISRRYAATVIDRWDVAFRHLPPDYRSELIIQWSGGYLSYPMLVLEDAIDSEIRSKWEVLEHHVPFLAAWGYENFSACEDGEPSPSPLAPPAQARNGSAPPYRVKLIPDWTSTFTLCQLWSRQSQGRSRWDDIEVTYEDEDVDYYAIVNYPRDGETKFRPDRTIVFQMEPRSTTEQWGPWSSPDPRKFLQVRTHSSYRNNLEWHLGLTYHELTTQPIPKTAQLSSVTSGEARLPGQRLRVAFLKYLEEHGTPIDIYGRDNPHGLVGYLCSLPVLDKRQGILPYRYTFAAENSSEPNYFTEKLTDAILGEALCFYWGCPNVEEYLDPDAFVRLDLEDFEASRRRIERAMEDDEWTARLGVIRTEKRRILDEYQFFPTLARIVHGHRFAERLAIRVVTPRGNGEGWASFSAAAAASAGDAFVARCERHPGDHPSLWRELAVADGEDPTLVIDAAARLCDGFGGLLVEVAGLLSDVEPEFDVVVLGATGTGDRHRAHRSVRLVAEGTPPSDLCAYIVSPRGARRLAAQGATTVFRCLPDLVRVGL